MASQGFYSVIQFCPDRERAEGVNVGIVLVCPDVAGLRVRMSDTNDYAKQRFARLEVDDERLSDSKVALQRRLEALGATADRDRLEDFIRRESGAFTFVAPRSIRVVQPDSELAELFDRLVRPPAPELQRPVWVTLASDGNTPPWMQYQDQALNRVATYYSPKLKPQPLRVPSVSPGEINAGLRPNTFLRKSLEQ